MTPEPNLLLRPAVLTDLRGITNLIHFSPHVHRHLDWCSPLDWIGSPPYFVIEAEGQVIAALGCPPDPPTTAWMRLFANSGKIPDHEAWNLLWEKTRIELERRKPVTVVAIALQEWLEEMLTSSGFTSHQAIVMLERNGGSPVEISLPEGVTLRRMMSYDLPAVAAVDAAAFGEIWQNTLSDLEKAYPQAVLATVAEDKGTIIGYQLSTRNPLGAHLARLAVAPSEQGRGVGRALVADLIEQAGMRGMTHLTVNTQSDNATSLTLYQKTGFQTSGERYPVYQYLIS